MVQFYCSKDGAGSQEFCVIGVEHGWRRIDFWGEVWYNEGIVILIIKPEKLVS